MKVIQTIVSQDVFDRTGKTLFSDEGLRTNPYYDHLLNKTVGIGTKLPLTAFEVFSIAEFRDEKGLLDRNKAWIEVKFPLSVEECEFLRDYRLEKVFDELRKNIPLFIDLPEKAQVVLGNMGYVMGVPRLMGFERMIEALLRGEYFKAGDEIIDSKWYRDLYEIDMEDGEAVKKNRAERLADMLRELADE